jgi:DNA-binding XRE family transcriptional regulator
MSLNAPASPPDPEGDQVATAPPARYRSMQAAPTRRKVKSLLGWRLRHGLDQRAAARILGVSQSTYGRFETKKRFPRPSVAKRMQIITGLSLEIILGLD